jgi:hypothetical protein
MSFVAGAFVRIQRIPDGIEGAAELLLLVPLKGQLSHRYRRTGEYGEDEQSDHQLD